MKMDIPQTIEDWNARGAAFLPGHLAMEFLEVGLERVRATLAVRRQVMSWNGFLHAGTVTSLADTCCGYGTLTALPTGADAFTTVDLQANFLGTALKGQVLCTANPLHVGRSTQVWDAEVTNGDTGKTIAHFRCTQLILWPRG